ncbi:MAG: hypothetical protein EIB84_00845 [Spiroplasma poulsonii]|uniref:Uncharacterized protein n=1 Tax=Spiroplasma poulsonii TaxID=2138 RepID=A0A2P6FB88_9MOLU|nr:MULTISPECIES: hypothetical protein [Spiroplasma]KAF0851133.1 hypothetical protein MSROBK_005510 [Spiroplasma poulsonii]MBH8622421.1 hypothetical protein [Spiroplasma sp. hyd1]MBW1241450.1 hypothetical protein [Spiroplasma poulsonii]PQM30727.1 hypothetical protein SMSRO_SF005140 [Spiroplasma poulsonii]PWF95713.1 hypothetical protein SMSE_11500 [Spiroplasma poulsonii]
MSIFDKNENERYAYFLTNFKEILSDWSVMVNDQFIKTSLDNSSTKLFGMNVDKAIIFFNINLEVNNTLQELGIIKESYSIDLINDLELDLNKKSVQKKDQKNYDVIYNQIDTFFVEDSELLKFCEYSLNVVNLSTETDGPTINALNNYKSIAFNSFPTKIYELLDWFGIDVVETISNSCKVKRFGVKENHFGSNRKLRRKPGFTSKRSFDNDNDDEEKINKESIFTEYFANNGDINAKLTVLNKLLPLLEEKRTDIKEFNPKLEYDIFSFLQHTKYRNSLTYQEDPDAEKRLDKVFKKAVLCLYLLDIG